MLQPLAVYLLLVIIVALRMAYLRVRDFSLQRLGPQNFALRGDRARLSEAAERTADHYQNLFEMPVVFITACLLVHVTGRVDLLYVAAAWLYVITRLVHSIIHLSYNRVYHRFLVFAASFGFLAVIVLRLVYQLFV